MAATSRTPREKLHIRTEARAETKPAPPPASPPADEKKNALTVPVANAKPPAALLERMLKDAGKGVSSLQEDNIVPLIYIMQPLSPQLQRNNAKFVQGAMAGDIMLRNLTDPMVPGDQGIIFQHCFFDKDWVEWIPRNSGGGFVGRSKERPDDAVEKVDPQNKNKKRWFRPNGNEVIETRYHIGYVHMDDRRLPYVIPFSSTGHTVSRSWMFTMNSKRLPSGDVAAGWSSLFKLITRERSNVSGTWFVFDPIDLGYVQSVEDYDLGERLYEAFNKGEKRVEDPDEGLHEEPASDVNGRM